ncbi:MAG: phage tail protein [Oscillospiraceae bacterium]|nr:phage tail protein [Oscillospiraceae bacterium]
MATNHGVYTTFTDTSVSTVNTATSGIPFVVGAAPLSSAEEPATAGTPVLATSWDEAVEQLGYSDDWDTYTLCEFMYSHFKLYGCQPVIFLPVGESATTATVAAGFEAVDLCIAKFGIAPDILCAPGYSSNTTVASVMSAKAAAVSGLLRAIALVDIDADSYTDAVTAKNSGSWDEYEIACWPMVTNGDYKFHMSTALAGKLAALDTENGGVPYDYPSNKTAKIDGLCDSSGNEIILTKAQADVVVEAGVLTALCFLSGWTFWGNYTAVYPSETDVAKYFIGIRRTLLWIANTLVSTFWSKVDKPMTRRLVDNILDSANIWLNGLASQDYLHGGRVEMLDSENPSTDLMAGKLKLHVYVAPPSPAQEIDFVVEYDADYVTAAFS